MVLLISLLACGSLTKVCSLGNFRVLLFSIDWQVVLTNEANLLVSTLTQSVFKQKNIRLNNFINVSSNNEIYVFPGIP